MTDFLTRFSCLLDVGTAANAARAFQIYSTLIADNAREDPPAEPFLVSLTPEHGPARLWLRDPGSADQQLAIIFVTRCAEAFGLTGRWGLQWANVASDPVADGFSGGAHCSIFRPAKRSNGSAPAAGSLIGSPREAR